MNCIKCDKPNRSIAKYCKYCGEAIKQSSNDALNSIVGHENIKAILLEQIDRAKRLNSMKGSSGNTISVNRHTIIVGETGTGKTMLANTICNLYADAGFIQKPKMIIIDAPQFSDWVQKYEDNIKNALGGILFLDNVQRLLPDGAVKSLTQLDKVFSGMEKMGNDPIIILSGLKNGFGGFISSNPDITSRFKYTYNLHNFSSEELAQIVTDYLPQKYNIRVDDACKEKLKKVFKHKLRNKDTQFTNAHEATRIAEQIFEAVIDSPDGGQVALPEHVKYDLPKERTLDEIMHELDDFIGMNTVKDSIREIANQVEMVKTREARGVGDSQKTGIHMILTGNPGTGKTTIARKLGEILTAIDYLDIGHVVEVDRSKIIGQYQGQTPDLVNEACDKAMGGILFVDEAYTLSPHSNAGDKDKYGQEAIDTLMKRMEDDRGKFVVIAAGYQKEMQQFLHANPGIESRIDKQLHIDDYTPEELTEIFKIFVKNKNYFLTPVAENLLIKEINILYENRSNNFGNGREMRRLFEETERKFSRRISSINKDDVSDEFLCTITDIDIPHEERTDLDPEACMQKLNELNGLDSVKTEIKGIINKINIEKQRGHEGPPKLRDHFIFAGNPGTGKTTVARIIADIFKSSGILSKGHLIEMSGNDLVAGYIGQTAIKTNQVIDSAMGGVLFIDEAYTLTPKDKIASFGQEAVDTLLKRMEDDKGKFVVIAAGYNAEMDRFIQSNPGLKSRFSRFIQFEDYKPEILEKILRAKFEKEKFALEEEADKNLSLFIEGIYKTRDKANFGNAREMNNIFEEAKRRQSIRLASSSELSPGDYNILTRSDIEGDAEKQLSLPEILKSMDEFIGMPEVKDVIRATAGQVKLMQERVKRGMASADQTALNIILTGNPGTGKTTVARKLGEVFKAVGILTRGHVVEVDRSQLIGQYQGQTPGLVNDACNRAMGGILFIDEAYTLAPVLDGGGKDKYGQEAIETLMKRIEDDRGKFITIVAGYKIEMEQFMNTNPGMKSRFNKKIHINDYSTDQLYQILEMFIKKEKYELSDEAKEIAKEAIEQICAVKDKNFANAREMRTLFEQIKEKMSERLMQINDTEMSDDMFRYIRKEDIPQKTQKILSTDDCMAELNELVGLESVKNEVKGLINMLNMDARRTRNSKLQISDHYIFTGNPGTGKTTVGRIMSKVFQSLGVLPNGHLIEVDSSDLIAGYIGQTSIKTNQVIDKALGGILFIDEAYAISESSGGFGQEAINTLLKRMEDDRGKFIVIAAGYTGNMNRFLGANPGLSSRFNKTITFEDYTPGELEIIFRNLVNKNGYKLSMNLENELSSLLTDLYNNRVIENFGNAREMRKLFEKAKQQQSTRIAIRLIDEVVSDDDIVVFEKEDLL